MLFDHIPFLKEHLYKNCWILKNDILDSNPLPSINDKTLSQIWFISVFIVILSLKFKI